MNCAEHKGKQMCSNNSIIVQFMIFLWLIHISHCTVLASKARVPIGKSMSMVIFTLNPVHYNSCVHEWQYMSCRTPVLQAVSVTPSLAAAWWFRISDMRSLSSPLTCALIEEKAISIGFRKEEYAIFWVSQLPHISAAWWTGDASSLSLDRTTGKAKVDYRKLQFCLKDNDPTYLLQQRYKMENVAD